MYIDQIEVTEIPSEDSVEKARAAVSFLSYERQVQVMCELHDEHEQSPIKRRFALMREGLRQLKRMPEFRTGEVLELKPGLLPDSAG